MDLDHVCVICNSPFLLDDSTTETETVATTCGHVFHRDCIAGHAALEGATCPVCHTTLREGNKFKKVFVAYDDVEHDKALLAEITSVTASDKELLLEERNINGLERHLEALREERLYNQGHIELLDVEWSAIQALCQQQSNRLKRIDQAIASAGSGRSGGA